MTLRYSLDQVGECEWVLFDREKKGTPKAYLLFLVPLGVGIFNYQIILTAYDAASAALSPFPVFTEEIYSMFFYSVPEGVADFILNIHVTLQELDIDDPLELAHYLGGTVHSEKVKTPTILNTN